MKNILNQLIDRDQHRRCVIDLGEMDPLRYAQYQQWHEVFLAGPTRSVVGTTSNDFPGLYYYDPRDQVQHVVMFEGDIDWRSCALDRRVVKLPDGGFHLLIGLFSYSKIDRSIKALHWKGKRILSRGQEPENRDAMPDQWEALDVLTRESFRLLPLPDAGEPADWQAEARKCLDTLQKSRSERVLGSVKLSLFFETFVSEQSTYKLEPQDKYKGTAELICQAGLASSLLSYWEEERKARQPFRELGIQLQSTLGYFYDEGREVFHNTYPPKGEEWTRAVFDTWYAFNNLFHVLRTARITGDKQLKASAHVAVNRIISFVRSCNYVIPLFAKLSEAKDQGGVGDAALVGIATNQSVLGMYAMVLVEAGASFRPDYAVYLDEARTALRNLRRWPINQMFHQTVQLSWAAWAAHRLGETDWRDDFVRCLLLSCYRQGPNSGLFQGCAGLMYPAFRESVEAVAPWVEFYDQVPDLPLRPVMKLVLEKAKGFLSEAPHAGLPQEGLPSREQPGASKIGVAVYAAPQVFDLASIYHKVKYDFEY